MKSVHFLIFAVGILVMVVGLSFVHVYTSSPGFISQEEAEVFYANVPSCQGVSFLLNRKATYTDAPGKSLCIGLLKKK